MAARKAHNLEVPGSNPGPATKRTLIEEMNFVLVKKSENRDRFYLSVERFYKITKLALEPSLRG